MMEWVGLDSKNITETGKVKTMNDRPQLTIAVEERSPGSNVNIHTYIDKKPIPNNYSPGAGSFTMQPGYNLSEGSHWAVVIAKTPDGNQRMLDLIFFVDKTPPRITDVLRDDPTNTLYVFFEEEMPKDIAENPYNWDINGISDAVVKEAKVLECGNVVRLKGFEGMPPMIRRPEALFVNFHGLEGISTYKLKDESQSRAGDVVYPCDCWADFQILATHDFYQHENSAICYKFETGDAPCQYIVDWYFALEKRGINEDPLEEYGHCTEASLDNPYDHLGVDPVDYDFGGVMFVIDNCPHTIEFTRGSSYLGTADVWMDCNDGENESSPIPQYETLVDTPTISVGTVDAVNPNIFEQTVDAGPAIADRLEEIVGDLEQQPNGDTWVEYGGGPLDYEDMLAYLRSQQGECETWALIGAEDPGHVLRGSDPFVPDWYKEDGVCGYGLMNMVIRIYVDIAPFGIHEGFEGEEYIDWPDQNPPYEGSYACDNLAFSEREYFLYQMWEDTDAKFMKMRVTDSLGNWTRSRYLYHEDPELMYRLEWYGENFEASYYECLSSDYLEVILYNGHRQFINLEKQTPTSCDPKNFGDYICLAVKCIPPNDEFWVRFSYTDPPIRPQSEPAFPWLGSEWDDPRANDNKGEGAGFGSSHLPVMDLPVPCDGIVETSFYTSDFGGDNYKIFVNLWDGQPPQEGEEGKLGVEIESPEIEVWRRYQVDVFPMDGWPFGEYMPLYDMVQGLYIGGYVLFNFWDLETTMYVSHLDDTDPRNLSPNLVLDYPDEVPDLQDEYIPIIPFHSPIDDFTTKHHHIHLQGTKYFNIVNHYGLTTNVNENNTELYNDHVHCFIALKAIEDGITSNHLPFEIQVNKVVAHEMGHALVDFPHHIGSIMRVGLIEIENADDFKFLGPQICTLRSGPYFDSY